jgi:hypothetical protein
MRISFAPIRMDAKLEISAAGDVLTVNGAAFDFSPLEEGDVLPREAIDSEWFAGDVTREGGEICVKLLKPHGPNPTEEEAFPQEVVL